ncbi:MAG: cytochrome bc complex cytochrome b subunit, partial [Metallosphaera sp.]
VWTYLTPGVEIGTIGLVVDAIIFIASFAVLWPILRYKIQPKLKFIEPPMTDGGTYIGLERPSILDNKLVYLVTNSSLILSITIVNYFLLQLLSSLTLGLLSAQFEIGKLIGLEFLLISVFLYVNIRRFGRK